VKMTWVLPLTNPTGHCEEGAAAERRSPTKQPRGPSLGARDCFAALAMTYEGPIRFGRRGDPVGATRIR